MTCPASVLQVYRLWLRGQKLPPWNLSLPVNLCFTLVGANLIHSRVVITTALPIATLRRVFHISLFIFASIPVENSSIKTHAGLPRSGFIACSRKKMKPNRTCQLKQWPAIVFFDYHQKVCLLVYQHIYARKSHA